MIHVRGGQVLTDTGVRRLDVSIDGQEIVELATELTGVPGQVIDATNCLVGPAFVDVHVHFREPGQTWKEDLQSGAAAAAAGGYSAVVTMPNTEPPLDNQSAIAELMESAAGVDQVEIRVAAAMTKGRQGRSLVDFQSLYRSGVRIFSDDGDSVLDEEVMGQGLALVSRLPGAVISQHAENHAMTRGGHMHLGDESRRLGIPGLPSEAEIEIVERDIDLVRQTGGRYHCQHVSTSEVVDLLREAKAERLPITSEVTPHHLSFTDADVERIGTNLKMYPPVREPGDRLALREGLLDGTIDMVATDHAPHVPEEKDVPFKDAPRGVIGLETAASVVSSVIGDPDRFFRVMSTAPAWLAGLSDHGRPLTQGGPPNIVVFDPSRDRVPTAFESKSSNSPYRGMVLKGVVKATIHKGIITYSEVPDGR